MCHLQNTPVLSHFLIFTSKLNACASPILKFHLSTHQFSGLLPCHLLFFLSEHHNSVCSLPACNSGFYHLAPLCDNLGDHVVPYWTSYGESSLVESEECIRLRIKGPKLHSCLVTFMFLVNLSNITSYLLLKMK